MVVFIRMLGLDDIVRDIVGVGCLFRNHISYVVTTYCFDRRLILVAVAIQQRLNVISYVVLFGDIDSKTGYFFSIFIVQALIDSMKK